MLAMPQMIPNTATGPRIGLAGGVILKLMLSGLTSRAQARGVDDVLRDSGTGPAIPRCLQRFVRPHFFLCHTILLHRNAGTLAVLTDLCHDKKDTRRLCG